VIVIDPLGDLPGAAAEGEALYAKLKNAPFDLKVLRQKEATVEAVRAAIADPGTDVLHYCGHAFFNGPGADQSGLQCADGPLTLANLRESSDAPSVPRLAVRQCVSGGARSRELERHSRAAGLRGVLPARRRRPPTSAHSGSSPTTAPPRSRPRVYAALARGLELGEAVVAGRKALQHVGNSDWANYVLYGHAGFRLVEAAGSSAERPSAALPACSFRVEGTSIVASWVFAAGGAPPSFAAAAFVARAVIRSSSPSPCAWIGARAGRARRPS